MKTLSSFTHFHMVPDPKDFKLYFFNETWEVPPSIKSSSNQSLEDPKRL